MELAEKERKKEEERRAQKVEQLENLVNGKGYNNKSSKAGATSSERSGKTSKEKTTKSNFRSGKYKIMQQSSMLLYLYAYMYMFAHHIHAILYRLQSIDGGRWQWLSSRAKRLFCWWRRMRLRNAISKGCSTTYVN